MLTEAYVVRHPGGGFEPATVELSELRSDEVLVRLVASGVCHTDLIIRDQWFPTPLPAVLGHEGSGVVAAVGADVRAVAVGDRVVLSYNFCGACRNCDRGLTMYCTEFWTHNFSGRRADGSSPVSLDGVEISGNFFGQSSFARHAVARERNVVRVPDGTDLPLELLGPLGCGIQTGAGAVLNALRPEPGASIAVFGAGAVGLSAVMAAAVAGCATIIAVDLVDARLDLARELGATHTVSGTDPDVRRRLLEIVPVGLDYAVEATGVPAVLRTAMDSIGQGGTTALVGAAAARTEASIDISKLLFGRRLIGVVEGESTPSEFIPRLLRLHAEGRFPFERLVARYPIADIGRAVADAESGVAIKPVVVMHD